MFDKELMLEFIKRWGLLGLIAFYFLFQDYQNRELDRQDRRDNVAVMKTLVESVNKIDSRVTVIETRLDFRSM